MKNYPKNYAREDALREFVNNNPGGHQQLAEFWLASLPFSQFKKACEEFQLEKRVNQIQKQKS